MAVYESYFPRTNLDDFLFWEVLGLVELSFDYVGVPWERFEPVSCFPVADVACAENILYFVRYNHVLKSFRDISSSTRYIEVSYDECKLWIF